MSVTPQALGTTPGQQVIVENIGIKRVIGTDLTTLATYHNWLFFLEDIKSFVIYSNDGSGIWYSALGAPAAGSLAVREALIPFEGQRYYVIEEDKAYQWVGGAWEGTVFEGNTIQPAQLILDETTPLTIGRKHLIVADGNYTVPTTDAKDGHEIEVQTVHNDIVDISIEADSFVFEGQEVTTVKLESHRHYLLVRYNGLWYVFVTLLDGLLVASNNLGDLTDVALARENLDVLSSEEVATDIATAKAEAIATVDAQTGINGIIKTGTTVDGDITYEPDYATEEEASNPTITDKVINPATLGNAVSASVRVNEYNNITGLLPQPSESQFLMTLNADPARNILDLPAFTACFNAEPYTKTAPLLIVSYPAQQVVLPNIVGTATFFIFATSAGTVTVEQTPPVTSETLRTFLGFAVTLDGAVIVKANLDDAITTEPWLASSDYSIRNSNANVIGGVFAPSPDVGKLSIGVAEFKAESSNWEVDTSNPHTSTFGARDPVPFGYLDRNGDLLYPLPNDTINGQYLDDGTTPVGNNNWSIQVAYLLPEGEVAVLAGQIIYATYTDAFAQLNSYAPEVAGSPISAVEIARWIVKGSQYVGNGALDLTQTENFTTIVSGSQASGSAASSASNITATTTNNYLHNTNVQTQLDELSHLATTVELTTEAMQVSRIYDCKFAGTKSFPSPAVRGDVVGLTRTSDQASQVFNTVDGSQFYFHSDVEAIDSELLLDTAGYTIYFVFDGFNWGAVNA